MIWRGNGGGGRGEVSVTFGEVDPQVVQLVSEPQEKCPTISSSLQSIMVDIKCLRTIFDKIS